MNDERLRRAYQELLAQRADAEQSVTLERLLALVEGTGSEEERLETLNQVMSSDALRAEFELLRAAAQGAESSETEDEATREEEAPSTPRWSTGLRVAAVAIVTLGVGIVWNQSRNPASDTLRGGASDLILVEPGATATTHPTFIWRSVEGATAYRLEVLTEDGAVVLEGASEDTIFSPEPDFSLESGIPYLWWVTATLPGGREVRAAARPLTVR